MKLIKVYNIEELAPAIRTKAQENALLYAAGMLMQANNCPPGYVGKMFQTFQDEFLGDYFSADGLMRVPRAMIKDEAGPAEEGAKVAQFPSGKPATD